MYKVTIYVSVHSPEALAAAARARAAADEISAERWDVLRAEGDAVSADLIMIFDPGQSPPGTRIEETTVWGG